MSQLPPDLWSRPHIAAALATCDIATVIEGVRAARGWSQGELARAVAYSQSWVSRVVNGQQSLTVTQVHDLAQRLDIPLHLLRFDGTVPPDADTAADTAPARTTDVAGTAGLSFEGGHIFVDETTAPSLRSITGGQRRMDSTSPARDLLPSAVSHVHLAERILLKARGTNHHSAVSAAASEASGFAAWLHADQGDMGSARMHYRTAVIRARQAGMRLLDVYMLGSLAAFEIDTAEDPELGLGLVQEAEHVLGPSAHPTARAWLACVGALAHAGIGDRSAAAHAIGRAEKEISRSGNVNPPWPWVFAFDQAKVSGYRALVGVRLQRPHDARNAFAEASGNQGRSVKQAAVLKVELASAHAEAGDIDEAFRLAVEALETGTRFGSARVVERVRSFRRRYKGPKATCVRDLDDRLALLASTAPAPGYKGG